MKFVPEAVKGSINLEGWNFDTRGIVKLDGQWEFYWNTLYTPHHFESLQGNEAPVEYFEMPGIWNFETGIVGGSSSIRSHRGCATLRLTVTGLTPYKRYGLKIAEMNSAYSLWINKNKIAANGQTSTTEDGYWPQFLPEIVFFSVEGNSAEMVLHISNYLDISGGSHHSILMGTEGQILSLRDRNVVMEIFLFASIFIMGLYHLWMYALNKYDRSYLFFGLFCVLISLRTFVTGESMLYAVFPGFPWFIGLKLEYLTMYLGFPTICLFFYSLYTREINLYYVKTIVVISIICAFVAVFIESHFNIQMIMIYQLIILTGSLYIFISILRAAIHRRFMARFMAIGFVLLYLTVLNDILYDKGVIHTGIIVPYGMFFFLISQMFALSFRYSMIFARNEKLTRELKIKNKEIQEYNTNLESKVVERTRKLNDAYDELNKTYNDLKEKDDMIEQDLSLAKSIQERIMPSIDAIHDLNFSVTYRPMTVVGGDIYDIAEIHDKYIRIFIADATGHGVQAALITMIIKSEYEKLKQFVEKPSQVLDIINKTFMVTYKSITHFFSCLVLDIDLVHNSISYASAGHNNQYIIKGDEVISLDSTGPLIGLVEDYKYKQKWMPLTRDMIMYLLTDGIYEVRDESNDEMFGIDRMIHIFKNNSNAKSAVKNLCKEINNFKGNKSFEDDITLIGMQFSPPEEK